MHGSLHPRLPWQQSIRVFVCLEAESSLPHRAGKACDNPVCRPLDPLGIPNSCLDSVHHELVAAGRLSSRCRLHQSLSLLHVDDSTRRGGSPVSAACGKRQAVSAAENTARAQLGGPCVAYQQTRIFEPITNWPPGFAALFPNSPPKAKALLPAQSRSAFTPATDPSFASAHQQKKEQAHHLQSRKPKSAAT